MFTVIAYLFVMGLEYSANGESLFYKVLFGFVRQLIGRKVEHFCCEADILDFGFSGGFVLHAMGCSRVVQDNDILVTTIDYLSWDEKESTNNDEWYNMSRLRDRVIGGTAVSVLVSPLNDLKVRLDNGVTIECLIANAYPHFSDGEIEQWVLFEYTKVFSGRFLTVYNKEVDFSDHSGSNED